MLKRSFTAGEFLSCRWKWNPLTWAQRCPLSLRSAMTVVPSMVGQHYHHTLLFLHRSTFLRIHQHICGPVLRRVNSRGDSLAFVAKHEGIVICVLRLMWSLQGQKRRRRGGKGLRKGQEHRVMMKPGQTGPMPSTRGKKVEWRLQRWTCPPLWCLALFGQMIPTDSCRGWSETATSPCMSAWKTQMNMLTYI